MGGGVVITSAMAAIDIACWDIKGKALGVPVYKLLGGKTNDKLRAYASQLQFGWRKDIEAKDGLTLLYDPKDYYRVVKEAVDEGYDAVKIDPVFAPTEPAPMGDVMATQGTQIRGCYREHDLKRSVERIAAARESNAFSNRLERIRQRSISSTESSFGRSTRASNGISSFWASA